MSADYTYTHEVEPGGLRRVVLRQPGSTEPLVFHVALNPDDALPLDEQVEVLVACHMRWLRDGSYHSR